MLDQVEGIFMNASAGNLLLAPKAILFDLDGTLVDSAPDIAEAVNELLAGRHLPPLTLMQVTGMIGNGVSKLVERAFAASGTPLTGPDLAAANRRMTPIYNRHLTRRTKLMPGATEAVARLQMAGIRLGVATNKPQVATKKILLHFGLAERFGAVVGGDAVVHKKPAPDALFLALDRLGVEPEQALMVGDSAADVGAARAAGMPVVLVRGGYTQIPVDELGSDRVIDSLQDLPATVQALPAAA
jgi:phosphoglycolate phosphatase